MTLPARFYEVAAAHGYTQVGLATFNAEFVAPERVCGCSTSGWPCARAATQEDLRCDQCRTNLCGARHAET